MNGRHTKKIRILLQVFGVVSFFNACDSDSSGDDGDTSNQDVSQVSDESSSQAGETLDAENIQLENDTSPEIAPPVGADWDFVPATMREGQITQIFDGDTIRVRWIDTQTLDDIRMLGVDAPETSDPLTQVAGNASLAFTETFLRKGLRVQIVQWDLNTDIDFFGRVLGEVWAGDYSMNLELLASGHAIGCVWPESYAVVERISWAQEIARSQALGIWDPAKANVLTAVRNHCEPGINAGISFNSLTAGQMKNVPGISSKRNAIVNRIPSNPFDDYQELESYLQSQNVSGILLNSLEDLYTRGLFSFP
jgi:endonuclease YncB( thermonuclease family)